MALSLDEQIANHLAEALTLLDALVGQGPKEELTPAEATARAAASNVHWALKKMAKPERLEVKEYRYRLRTANRDRGRQGEVIHVLRLELANLRLELKKIASLIEFAKAADDVVTGRMVVNTVGKFPDIEQSRDLR